jgi:transcription elongation factor Elf1
MADELLLRKRFYLSDFSICPKCSETKIGQQSNSGGARFSGNGYGECEFQCKNEQCQWTTAFKYDDDGSPYYYQVEHWLTEMLADLNLDQSPETVQKRQHFLQDILQGGQLKKDECPSCGAKDEGTLRSKESYRDKSYTTREAFYCVKCWWMMEVPRNTCERAMKSLRDAYALAFKCPECGKRGKNNLRMNINSGLLTWLYCNKCDWESKIQYNEMIKAVAKIQPCGNCTTIKSLMEDPQVKRMFDLCGKIKITCNECCNQQIVKKLK